MTLAGNYQTLCVPSRPPILHQFLDDVRLQARTFRGRRCFHARHAVERFRMAVPSLERQFASAKISCIATTTAASSPASTSRAATRSKSISAPLWPMGTSPWSSHPTMPSRPRTRQPWARPMCSPAAENREARAPLRMGALISVVQRKQESVDTNRTKRLPFTGDIGLPWSVRNPEQSNAYSTSSAQTVGVCLAQRILLGAKRGSGQNHEAAKERIEADIGSRFHGERIHRFEMAG